MIGDPDIERHHEPDFYRQQCEVLQSKLEALQVEHGRIRQEFRRAQITAHVIEELYRLANRQAPVDELGELLVEVLVKTLSVDSAALLKWEEQRGRFAIVCSQGFLQAWTLAIPPADVPAGYDSGWPERAPPSFLDEGRTEPDCWLAQLGMGLSSACRIGFVAGRRSR